MEINENHEKIINILRIRGPSLPIQIAKELSMNSLFISAFLSELADSKRIKVSSLKVGGSPLYYLIGQEEKLENFYKYLHPLHQDLMVLHKFYRILSYAKMNILLKYLSFPKNSITPKFNVHR